MSQLLIFHFIGSPISSPAEKKKKNKGKCLYLKDIFFYPGIILSCGWTLINFVKMINFMDQMRNESPECMASNPNSYIIFITTIIALASLKSPVERGATSFF